MISSLNSTCRDFNAKLKHDVVIYIRATFKIANWQKFLECRDIKFLVATLSTLGGTSHPLVVKATIISRC